MIDTDHGRQRSGSWMDRSRRIAREFRQAVIGPTPERPTTPWKHHASYVQWLAENKKPHPLRDALAHWFAVVFILTSVLGGVLVLTHASLGWP